MWSLKILSGELSGQTFPLNEGVNSIGRDKSCDIVIPHNGISKKHAQIVLKEGKIHIQDMRSTNGTFIDGVGIRNSEIRPGQKLSFNDIVVAIQPSAQFSTPSPPMAMPIDGSLAINYKPDQDPTYPEEQNKAAPVKFQEHAFQYVNEVILPGAYKLAEKFEFKSLFFGVVALFIVLITGLSTIPLTQILKKRIEKTSQQRALTIARLLANKNRASVLAGQVNGVQTSYVANEPGVAQAFIINPEGRILAPPALAQQIPNIPFVAQAKLLGEEVFQQIDDNTIGASAPISAPAANGRMAPLAYAVIVYDMGSLAVDDGQTFSLFIQTLLMALIVGAIVFFFLYKIVVLPLYRINDYVESALRDSPEPSDLNYNFSIVNKLLQNLQSLVARMGQAGNDFNSSSPYEHERSLEAKGLVSLIGYPALSIDLSGSHINATNSAFLEQISQGSDWSHIKISEITDQALRLNIEGLVDQSQMNPNMVATDTIELHGFPYELQAQAIFGNSEVSYIVVSFIPIGNED